MEERYEIRGKIGQGGLGAVYRGYDTRMKREIAIKRISVATDDPALQEESTRQLIKEAGALASLQHPHIVTVYDVGADEDGPYVVMELISGKTLDELIERAPLTWADFRELALQTQEALIAAQELDLIHSDIKPSNLMLTWLPSGRFQVKIVDFGLATLTQSQSLEELQELEAVFGSIFFMAPEQFERVPIDCRTDMYAMGCVYYQALTGIYPFRGETGNEVMVSHLHHTVTPLQDLRPGIPLWVCDWVMWHINRKPDDRPESARQALHVFLQNDKTPTPTMSLGQAKPVVPPGPRARLAIPQAGTMPGSANRRVIPAAGSPRGPVAAPPPPADGQAPPPPERITAPQPLEPPEGSKPSVHMSTQAIPDVAPTGSVSPTAPMATTQRVYPSGQLVASMRKPKKGHGLKIGIAVAMVVVAAVLAFFLKRQVEASKESGRGARMLQQALLPGTREIPMTGKEFGEFLQRYADETTEGGKDNVMKLINVAVPSDQSDFEATLVNFATTYLQMLPETREALIRKAVAPRMNAAAVDPMVKFARESNDTPSAVAALEAVKSAAGADAFPALLMVMEYHPSEDMRKAAGEVAAAVLKRSGNSGATAEQLDKAIQESNGDVRKALEALKSGS